MDDIKVKNKDCFYGLNLIRLYFAELNSFQYLQIQGHATMENLDHTHRTRGCFLIASKCKEDPW